MATKIPQTKQEAFAQLDEMLSEEEKSELVKGARILCISLRVFVLTLSVAIQ